MLVQLTMGMIEDALVGARDPESLEELSFKCSAVSWQHGFIVSPKPKQCSGNEAPM